jgi:hypothetical protein
MPLTPVRTLRKKLESHPSHRHPSRAAFRLRPGEQGKKSAKEKGCGHRYLGQRRCEQYADGWSPGSCYGVICAGGHNSPHLLRCNSCSLGLNGYRLSLSTTQPDLRQQSTGISLFSPATSFDPSLSEFATESGQIWAGGSAPRVLTIYTRTFGAQYSGTKTFQGHYDGFLKSSNEGGTRLT